MIRQAGYLIIDKTFVQVAAKLAATFLLSVLEIFGVFYTLFTF